MLTDKNKHSFCPAHWDDIHFAPVQGYVQGCCKSVPVKSIKDLEVRKKESINGIRPAGCEYCWKAEDAGEESFRHYKIKRWDGTSNHRMLTMVLGNLCNFQCVYCNEKYSTKWQSDKKRNGQIEMKFDTNVYYGDECVEQDSQVFIDFFNQIQPTETLTVSGGEPLMGNIFYEILNRCDLSSLNRIVVNTNLCWPDSISIDKLLEYQSTHKIVINVSLDTVDTNLQEQLRYGFKWDTFKKNLDYLLNETNVHVTFNSLLTANSINGIEDLYDFIYGLKDKYPNRVNWFPSHCVQPRIFSYNVLTDDERYDAICAVQRVIDGVDPIEATLLNKTDRELTQLKTIKSALQDSVFDADVKEDQNNFMKQFNERMK